jgi:8-oxo-dGTP pyrophosphatase MutT (NUDIX family)
MARDERSAGFLVFHRRRNGGGLTPPNDLRFLLLDYGRHWDFPKGHVEPGETELQAAVRELREETGIRDITPVSDFEREIVYFFRSTRKGLIRKTVTFFLAEVKHTDVILSEEHVGYEFLPFDPAVKRVTFAAAKELLRAAHAHLAQQGSTAATA